MPLSSLQPWALSQWWSLPAPWTRSKRVPCRQSKRVSGPLRALEVTVEVVREKGGAQAGVVVVGDRDVSSDLATVACALKGLEAEARGLWVLTRLVTARDVTSTAQRFNARQRGLG
jgi:hypothetical protein